MPLVVFQSCGAEIWNPWITERTNRKATVFIGSYGELAPHLFVTPWPAKIGGGRRQNLDLTGVAVALLVYIVYQPHHERFTTIADQPRFQVRLQASSSFQPSNSSQQRFMSWWMLVANGNMTGVPLAAKPHWTFALYSSRDECQQFLFYFPGSKPKPRLGNIFLCCPDFSFSARVSGVNCFFPSTNYSWLVNISHAAPAESRSSYRKWFESPIPSKQFIDRCDRLGNFPPRPPPALLLVIVDFVRSKGGRRVAQAHTVTHALCVFCRMG